MAPKKPAVEKKEEEKAAPAAEEPAAKKAKTDEKPEEQKKAEESSEKETDAPNDSRAAFKGTICFENAETTLNVVKASADRVLMSLADGGMQFLIAGARANVGLKGGRYLYEVKTLESLTPEGHGKQGPMPKQLLRVGFSIGDSSLILGDGEGGVYFDSEGQFYANGKRAGAGKRFARDSIAAVLLNLDAKSENANTISLFVNGERASKPWPLPETLQGKPLFPHISYRNVTVHVHFGPEPLRPLPFKCRTIQAAANSDVSKSRQIAPADGKYDVIFPVGFPDEGTFACLDAFLEKNPQYVELSDRKIIEWAAKSGLHKKGPAGCNDKPMFNFGIPAMDDHSVSKIISTVAPMVPRHYVVMEVKQNLLAKDRTTNVKKFASKHFKRIAQVMMGEPSKSYKAIVKSQLLKGKQALLDSKWKLQKLEKEKKKAQAARLKEVEKKRQALMEARKKAAADKAKAEGKDAEGAEAEEKKEEDGKEKEEAKQDKTEEEAKLAEEAEEEDEGPEQAALTEEEEKIWFPKQAVNDLTMNVLNGSYAEFSIPDKAEGFDEIKFEWQKEKASKDYLHDWIIERKRTSRIDNLEPSTWFKEQQADFAKKLMDWQAKQKVAQSKTPNKKTDDEEEEAGIDIFSVEDVSDVGKGVPLFLDFTPQDWALLTLRWELHLLATAFKKDVNDVDRTVIPEQHVAFYFTRYYKKNLNTKAFAVEALKDLVAMVKDTISLDGEPTMFSSKLTEDATPDMTLKLTEEKRRERQRRIDAGDETAKLKFNPQAEQPKATAASGKAAGKGAKKS